MTEEFLRHDRRYKSGAELLTGKSCELEASRPVIRGARFNSTSLAAAWMSTACLAFALAGCSMSMQIASLTASNDDATGSIPKASFAHFLDAEDLRRAKAALDTALDPQGNGSLVGWANPESGAKGSFTPIGAAYPSDAKICRVFLSQIDRKGNARSMRGTACSEKAGDWAIAEINPTSKDLRASN